MRVGLQYRGSQPMRDNERRAIGHQPIQRLLHQHFTLGIERADVASSRSRIGASRKSGACNGDALGAGRRKIMPRFRRLPCRQRPLSSAIIESSRCKRSSWRQR